MRRKKRAKTISFRVSDSLYSEFTALIRERSRSAVLRKLLAVYLDYHESLNVAEEQSDLRQLELPCVK